MILSSAGQAANDSLGQLNINQHHLNAVHNYDCMSKNRHVISPTDCCGDEMNDTTAVNKDLTADTLFVFSQTLIWNNVLTIIFHGEFYAVV